MKELYKTGMGTVSMVDTSTLQMIDVFGHSGFIHMDSDGTVSIWSPEGDHVETFKCSSYEGKDFIHVNRTSMDNFTRHIWAFVPRLSILHPMRSFLAGADNFLTKWGSEYLIPMLRSEEYRQYA